MANRKFRWIRFTLLACAVLAAALANSDARAENPGKRNRKTVPDGAQAQTPHKTPPANPVVQLACDPTVHNELQLVGRQIAAIEALYSKIERPLWHQCQLEYQVGLVRLRQ